MSIRRRMTTASWSWKMNILHTSKRSIGSLLHDSYSGLVKLNFQLLYIKCWSLKTYTVYNTIRPSQKVHLPYHRNVHGCCIDISTLCGFYTINDVISHRQKTKCDTRQLSVLQFAFLSLSSITETKIVFVMTKIKQWYEKLRYNFF